jgi:hypothetical protein
MKRLRAFQGVGRRARGADRRASAYSCRLCRAFISDCGATMFRCPAKRGEQRIVESVKNNIYLCESYVLMNSKSGHLFTDWTFIC